MVQSDEFSLIARCVGSGGWSTERREGSVAEQASWVTSRMADAHRGGLTPTTPVDFYVSRAADVDRMLEVFFELRSGPPVGRWVVLPGPAAVGRPAAVLLGAKMWEAAARRWPWKRELWAPLGSPALWDPVFDCALFLCAPENGVDDRDSI